MRDRYGELPPEAIALGELMVVKGLAQALGATVVDLAETRLSLTLSEVTPLRPTQVVKLVSDRASGFRLTPEMRLIRTLRAAEQEHPLGAARKILHDLLGYANRNYLK
jgi:transcription-repair coupling factor (superfamily II helicase)